MQNGAKLVRATLACLSVSACMVGPNYKRPSTPLTSTFKELPGWHLATPADEAPKGQWWDAFHDPLLNRLEAQIDTGNQTLREQVAAYENAQALVDEARANLFPTLSGNVGATRSSGGGGVLTSTGGGANTLGTTTGTTTGTTGVGTTTTGGVTSGNGNTGSTTSVASTGGGGGFGGGGNTRTTFTLEGSADWNLDVWGKLRRQVESNVANAQANAALVANARLSAQGSLATAYLNLRVSDALQRVLDETTRLDTEALRIARNQVQRRLLRPLGRNRRADPARSCPIRGHQRGRRARAIRTRHRHADRRSTRLAHHPPRGKRARGAGHARPGSQRPA